MRSSTAIWAGVLASLLPLAASVWGYRIDERSEARRRFEQFSGEADRLASALADHVEDHEDVTRSLRSLLSAAPTVDPPAFSRFVKSLSLDTLHPEVLAVGYAPRAAGEQSDGTGAEYFPIQFL